VQGHFFKPNLMLCSLVTLTGQNALLGLSMRFARTRPGDMFISTTAVFMAEIGGCAGIYIYKISGVLDENTVVGYKKKK
jgi:hypothetical protein